MVLVQRLSRQHKGQFFFFFAGDLEAGLFSEDKGNTVFGLSRFRTGVLSRLAILRMSLLCPSGMPVRWFSVRYLALVVKVKPEVKFQASHLLRMPSRF